MAASERVIRVGDDLGEVARVQGEFERWWAELGLPAEEEAHFSLALEEAVSNVIRHGEAPGASKAIEVRLVADGDRVLCEVSDGCARFDPLARPEPDVTAPLAERRPGGLGIFLLRQTADELTYEYREGRNWLRYRRKFQRPL